MDKDTQRLISTIIGIGLLVAVFLYLKKFMGSSGAFGFGLGGGNNGQGGGLFSSQSSTPDYSPSATVVPDKPKLNVVDALHAAAQKLAYSNGKKATKPGDFTALLFDADKASAAYLNKFGKDPQISWALFQFGPACMDDDTFYKNVTAWLKKANYSSIKQTNIFKTKAQNPEIADFINRALNDAKIK